MRTDSRLKMQSEISRGQVMLDNRNSARILGIHPVVPTAEEFREAIMILRGEGLEGLELAEAEAHVREHFDGLYLIELQIGEDDPEFDWSCVTQPVEGQPPENWQVAYDEQNLDGESGRWAFFFHYLDTHSPLRTSQGDLELPAPTRVPPHLEWIRYEVP